MLTGLGFPPSCQSRYAQCGYLGDLQHRFLVCRGSEQGTRSNPILKGPEYDFRRRNKSRLTALSDGWKRSGCDQAEFCCFPGFSSTRHLLVPCCWQPWGSAGHVLVSHCTPAPRAGAVPHLLVIKPLIAELLMALGASEPLSGSTSCCLDFFFKHRKYHFWEVTLCHSRSCFESCVATNPGIATGLMHPQKASTELFGDARWGAGSVQYIPISLSNSKMCHLFCLSSGARLA